MSRDLQSMRIIKVTTEANEVHVHVSHMTCFHYISTVSKTGQVQGCSYERNLAAILEIQLAILRVSLDKSCLP